MTIYEEIHLLTQLDALFTVEVDVHWLNKLGESGTFDEQLELDIKRVLRSDEDLFMFAQDYGKVDIVDFARSKDSKPEENIHRAMADQRYEGCTFPRRES
ncbi:hypothetical protein EYZ11_001455 [Aspergillus tanneri]|uniref:Uncharacterized protein n=1 Tax=Aspergillus tanneri TaxID=1220188 RepID=A0A4S3JUJ3_9EURO|nr:hypothetical protein EYZ11_001455 [Aspergillus tanneri]